MNPLSGVTDRLVEWRKTVTKRVKALYVSFRSRRPERVNVYQLALRDAPLPEGITVRSKPTGNRPKSTLRFAASYEVFKDKGWVKGPPTNYLAETVGEWVLDSHDMVVSSHGEAFFPDGRWMFFPYVNAHDPRGHSTPGTSFTVDEPVWIIQNGSDAYGHWLLHVLPRIHRALQLDPTRRILTRHPGWNPEGLLSMFGLTLDDIVWFPRDESRGSFVKVADGRFISHAAPRGNTFVHPLDSARFDSLVEDFLTRVEDVPSPVGRKLYVSRSTKNAHAKRDGCQNREALEEFFAAEGFEVVYPEKYSFPQQVAMFRDAEIIAAEGGSAPHNVLFSKPETKLLYISARIGPANNHWQLRIADFKRLNYRLLTPTTEFSQRKYTVDIDTVRAAYESLRW